MLQALYLQGFEAPHKTAADRNRTGTGITTHGILSPGRLPVPPLRQKISDRRTYPIKWTVVDSNHRSNLQQIYSLSPLATREIVQKWDL